MIPQRIDSENPQPQIVRFISFAHASDWVNPLERLGSEPASNSRKFPFRYRSIIGNRLRARHPRSQAAEAVIACNILNRMAEIGWPESFAVGSG